MGYVIVRTDGLYLAPPGSDQTYTDDIRKAVRYARKPDANELCMENERAVSVDSLLQPVHVA